MDIKEQADGTFMATETQQRVFSLTEVFNLRDSTVNKVKAIEETLSKVTVELVDMNELLKGKTDPRNKAE